MEGKDKLEQGRDIGRKLWGKARFDRWEKGLGELHPVFRDLALDTWSLYARPGVDLRTRSLCTIGALAVLGHEDVLKLHIFGALNNSVTQLEIEEVIVQVCMYAGDPRMRAALQVAKKAFQEHKPKAD